MNPETFFDNFGMLADVPDGVSKLRGLILQLAVQGKLVPQDPNDEPASVLLEKIKAKRLVKKTKELPSIKKNDAPYLLPKGWEWAMLGEIAEIAMGNSPPGNTYNEIGEGVPLINGPVEFSNGPFGFTIKSKFTTKATKFCEKGDLLVCVRGSTTGRTNIAAFEACIGRGVAAIRSKVHQPYINYFILSMRQQIYDLGTGSTFPSISQKHLLTFLVPLPPLAEQNRIVAKVDQLMALCDELEARQQKKQEARLRLNSAALDKLLTAHEPIEFAHHWQRVCDNFYLLYDNPETVGELRKAILQLAVQGRLVRQEENDESAAVLLGKIRVEKERLVKEGKIRKNKLIPLTECENLLYNIPKGWKWVHLGSLGQTQTGTTPSKNNPAFFGYDYPFIKPGDISHKYINCNNEGLSNIGIENGRFIKSGSILMVCIGGSIGKVNWIDKDCSCNQQINVLTPFLDMDCKLFTYFMRSHYFQNEVITRAPKTTLPILSKGKWELIPFPLPPFEEQRRIVAKVDQLMALCDDLEAKLKQSQTDGGILMEAVVHKLVAA